MEIFKLFGSIFVDSDAADKSLKKTEDNAKSVATSFTDGIKTVGKWGAAIGGVAAAGASALYGMATNSAAAMDEIDKGSAKMGISKKAYQEWSYVMGQNGMDISTLSAGMKTLVNQMESAANGSASASAYFDQLGISIYDTNGNLKDQETMLNEAIYALAEVEDSTLRSALATDLFGKAGTEMLPMLGTGAEGMAELTDRAHDLGLVMSDEAVTSGVVLGDTMDDVKQSFGAVVNTIGVEVMPIIQSFLNWVLDNMPTIREVIGKVFDAIGTVVSTVVGAMQKAFEALQPVFEIVKEKLGVLKGAFEENLPEIQAFFGKAVTAIIDTWENHLKPAFEAIGKFIGTVLKPIFEVVFEKIGEAVKVAFDMIVVTWKEVLKPAFDGICDFVENVFAGDWYGAWVAIVNTFSEVFGGIADAAKVPINWVITYVNKAIDAINGLSFDIPDWVPGFGGDTFGFNIPKIPQLAEGGVLERGQIGLLEGNGAEAVVPLERNEKWISSVAQDMEAHGIGGIDYNRLAESVVWAIREVIPELQDAHRIEADENNIFRVVRRKADEYSRKTGNSAFA